MEKCNHGSGSGTLYVVGTGPGSVKQMTLAASEVLEKAEVIIGYSTYLELIPEFLAGQRSCFLGDDERSRSLPKSA